MRLQSLVGVTYEYRVKGVVVTDTLEGTKAEIRKTTAEALKLGAAGVPILAEMWNYYSIQKYFAPIRGTFVFGRLRQEVEKWVGLNSEERVAFFIKALSRVSPHRDQYLKAVRFLLKVHPRYTRDFKDALNKEEYEYIR